MIAYIYEECEKTIIIKKLKLKKSKSINDIHLIDCMKISVCIFDNKIPTKINESFTNYDIKINEITTKKLKKIFKLI